MALRGKSPGDLDGACRHSRLTFSPQISPSLLVVCSMRSASQQHGGSPAAQLPMANSHLPSCHLLSWMNGHSHTEASPPAPTPPPILLPNSLKAHLSPSCEAAVGAGASCSGESPVWTSGMDCHLTRQSRGRKTTRSLHGPLHHPPPATNYWFKFPPDSNQ